MLRREILKWLVRVSGGYFTLGAAAHVPPLTRINTTLLGEANAQQPCTEDTCTTRDACESGDAGHTCEQRDVCDEDESGDCTNDECTSDRSLTCNGDRCVSDSSGDCTNDGGSDCPDDAGTACPGDGPCVSDGSGSCTDDACLSDASLECQTDTCRSDSSGGCEDDLCRSDSSGECKTDQCVADSSGDCGGDGCTADASGACQTDDCIADKSGGCGGDTCVSDKSGACQSDSCVSDKSGACESDDCLSDSSGECRSDKCLADSSGGCVTDDCASDKSGECQGGDSCYDDRSGECGIDRCGSDASGDCAAHDVCVLDVSFPCGSDLCREDRSADDCTAADTCALDLVRDMRTSRRRLARAGVNEAIRWLYKLSAILLCVGLGGGWSYAETVIDARNAVFSTTAILTTTHPVTVNSPVGPFLRDCDADGVLEADTNADGKCTGDPEVSDRDGDCTRELPVGAVLEGEYEFSCFHVPDDVGLVTTGTITITASQEVAVFGAMRLKSGGQISTPGKVDLRTSAWLSEDGTPIKFVTALSGEVDETQTGFSSDAHVPPVGYSSVCTWPLGLNSPKETGKAVEKCQKAIKKVALKFSVKKLKSLHRCIDAVFKCLQTKVAGEQAECLGEASATCGKEMGKIVVEEEKASEGMDKKCADVALADLQSEAGMYFKCGALCAPGKAGETDAEVYAAIRDCIVDKHECMVEELLGKEVPRARGLLERAGVDTGVFECLPGAAAGDGSASVGDPKGRGKAIDRCQAAVKKAGGKFAAKKLKGLEKCVDAVFKCVQLNQPEKKAGDYSKCKEKAATTCLKEFAKIAGGGKVAAEKSEAGKLRAAVLKGCERAAGADVLGDEGMGFSREAAQCATFGVASLGTLDDVIACVYRQHECKIEEMLLVEVPRVGELLSEVGRSLEELRRVAGEADPFPCPNLEPPPPTATSTTSTTTSSTTSTTFFF